MELVQLNVQPRMSSGKGVARKLRAKALTPGIIYGRKQEPLHIQLCPQSLRSIVRNSPVKRNVVFELVVEGHGTRPVLIKAVQHHPVTRDILHVDFLNVVLDEPIVITVPTQLVGRSIGVKEGGRLSHLIRRVEISCLPKDIPTQIDIDVTDIDRKMTMRVESVKPPEGVSIQYRQNFGVAAVS